LQQTRQSILSQLSRARSTARVTSDSMNWLVPYVSLEVDEAGLLALFTMPGITSLTEDGTFELYLSQSTLVIDADYAWNWGYTGRGYSVAVLDTGVDRRHNFLVNRVVAEACFSRNFCPNGRTTQTGTGASSPHICANTYGYYGDCSHGTHVAGIAAGRLASGLRGVAPEARIVGIQVFSIGGARPTAYWSDIVSGLNYVFSRRNTNKIAAANMSLGGGGFSSTCNSLVPALTSIIVQLRNAGVPTVISSGNDGYTNMIGAPSCISSAVSVGSTTKSDAISSFSNRAPFMTLFAPGSAIYSSTYQWQRRMWRARSLSCVRLSPGRPSIRW
jgi:subtilisin family serine protease